MVEITPPTTNDTQLTLRPISQPDAALLWQACWPHLSLLEVETRVARWLGSHAKGLAWGLVAEVAEQVVGVGLLVRHTRGAEICDLVVAEPWRNNGIGTALICALLEKARECHINQVEIGGAESNPRAVALYERLGFHRRRVVFLDLGSGPEPVIYLSRSTIDNCPPHSTLPNRFSRRTYP